MKRKPKFKESRCGCCVAGVLIGVNGNEIQRCDECAFFGADSDAVRAVFKVFKQAIQPEAKANRS